MPAVTTIIIDDYSVHQDTAHITVEVHTHTVDGNASWDGPKKQYGCDLQTFRDRFNSDIEQFEAWVVNEHKALTGPPPGLADSLLARKGKAIA